MTTSVLDASTTNDGPSALPSPPPSLHLLEVHAAPPADILGEEPSELIHARELANRQNKSAIVKARLAQALHCYGRTAEALSIASEAAALGRDSDPAAVTASALVLLTGGDLAKAETILGRQSTPMARFIFSLCAVHRRDYDKAFARLKGLDTYEAWSLAGWIHLQRFEFMAAVKACRRALDLGEPTPDVMVNLAYAHTAIGNRKSARRAASIAVALAPADRQASGNLITALASGRDFSGALKETERLERHRPTDLLVPITKAMLYRQLGDIKTCNRVLKSLKSDKRYWAASPSERAELKAHLALVDLQQGRTSPDGTKAALQKIMIESDFQNLTPARAFIGLCAQLTDAPKVRELVDKLSEHHPQQALYWASSQLAFLEQEYDVALDRARNWMLAEPFNMSAVSQLQYLLIEYKQDYSQAISIGRKFLRRIDDRDFVLNNTAYAMVMDGHLDDARRLLLSATESPMSLATKGLLSIRAGDRAAGTALYDSAARMANETGDPAIALLLKARKALELEGSTNDQNELRELANDARFVLMIRDASQFDPTH